LPRISIITINYNNSTGLEKTINSVINQKYFDYEYLIIDGNSTDGSKEIIDKYSRFLFLGISENDNGIYNAMNKGIMKSNGDYLFFLNSGDYFFDEQSLSNLANEADEQDFIYGNTILIYEKDS
jgi:glycosyltransferase involved in cell wall biosynthesis